MTDMTSKVDYDDDQRVLRNYPRTLQELSSIKLAFCMHVFQFDAKTLDTVSRDIRNLIKSKIEPVAKELECWVEDSNDVLEDHLSIEDIRTRFHLVVFGGNGTIHFKATICNFLKDDTLSKLARFEIACAFCVEEKVDVFWPFVCDELHIDDMNFYNDFMRYYWICRKKGELNRLPVGRFQSVDHLMIENCRGSRHWLAMEYFLNNLDSNARKEQINQLFCLDSECKFGLIKYLLPYFDDHSQHEILNIAQAEIIRVLLRDYTTTEYAFQAWIYIRDFIEADLFYRELILRYIRGRHYNKTSSEFEYSYAEGVLVELWSKAKNHSKEHIMNKRFPYILKEICSYRGDPTKNLRRDIRFALALLSDVDFQLRNTFWTENWQNWIVGVRSSQLEELMKLCLGNSKDVEEFKRTLKDSDVFRDYLNELVNRGYHRELNEVIGVLSLDQNELLNIKKKLLKTNKYWVDGIFYPKDLHFIEEFAKLIDGVFLNEDQAKDFKDQLILSEDNFKILYLKIDYNDFLDIETIVELYLSSQRKVEVKNKFLEYFRNRITRGMLYGFYASDWTNFLSWCLNGDKLEIKRFIKSLPICDILQVAFFNCLEYKSYNVVKELNEFLEWYFESPNSLENFIRERIKFYQEMDEADVNRIFGLGKELVIGKMKELLLDKRYELCDIDWLTLNEGNN